MSRASTECAPTISTASIAARPCGMEAQPAQATARPSRSAHSRREIVGSDCNRRGIGLVTAGSVPVTSSLMRRCIAVVSFIGLVGLVAGEGCSSGLRHPPYAPQPPSALLEVTLPPPPGRVESVPAAPTRDAVWVDGEWRWRRHKWGVATRLLDGGTSKDAKFSPWVFVRGLGRPPLDGARRLGVIPSGAPSARCRRYARASRTSTSAEVVNAVGADGEHVPSTEVGQCRRWQLRK
jgi:hypothetical protein